MYRILKFVLYLFIIYGIAAVILKVPHYHVVPDTEFEPLWGITFSKIYAEELELDWKETYRALLDELEVDRVRIPVYWNDISPTRGFIDFSDYIYMLEEAEKRDVRVIIALGERLPRWPECHVPTWTEGLPEAVYEELLLDTIEKAVRTFSHYQSIEGWQIENEPFAWWFGECKGADRKRIEREIALVRQLDDRPIIVADSGELGTWKKTFSLGADILGITTYRVTWNPLFGYAKYPLPASFYHLRARFAGIPWEKIESYELQAEPWTPGTPILETPIDKQRKSFNAKQFEANLNFARDMEVSRAYLWGAEWWYWLKVQGDESVWRVAKELWK